MDVELGKLDTRQTPLSANAVQSSTSPKTHGFGTASEKEAQFSFKSSTRQVESGLGGSKSTQSSTQESVLITTDTSALLLSTEVLNPKALQSRFLFSK